MRLALNLALALGLVAVPALGDVAYVTCQSGEEVSVLDLDAARERVRWAVPGKPAGVAVQGAHVFTVAPDTKTVRRHLAASGAVVAQVELDGGPTGIALDAARGRLFVSDWYNARLWVLDSATLAVASELSTGPSPAGLALSEDGRFLASADKEADQVSIFDAQTLARLHQTKVGANPFGLRFAPDGRLFVANVGTSDVSVVDPSNGAVLATVPVGERPYGVAFAAGRAFVTNQYANTVSVIALDTLAPEPTIDVGDYPEGIDTTTDGAHVVLVNWFDNTVTVIDAQSRSVINTWDTCDGPRAFGTFLLGGGTQ